MTLLLEILTVAGRIQVAVSNRHAGLRHTHIKGPRAGVLAPGTGVPRDVFRFPGLENLPPGYDFQPTGRTPAGGRRTCPGALQCTPIVS